MEKMKRKVKYIFIYSFLWLYLVMVHNEVWVYISKTNGNYSVSNKGNVRSNGYFDSLNRWKKPKILKPQNNSNGYLFIGLGRKRFEYVHRLVCEAFIGLPENMHVNHKDGNKSNNNCSNLEAVTRSQNDIHKKRNLEWHRYPILDLETGIFYANSKELFEIFIGTRRWKYPMWKSYISGSRLPEEKRRFIRV